MLDVCVVYLYIGLCGAGEAVCEVQEQEQIA